MGVTISGTYRKRVYIAGPMSKGKMSDNVRSGMTVAHELMELGYAPFTPHLTHFLDVLKSQPYETWLECDFSWIRVCDALLRLPGESPGADREVALAEALGIPVFHSISELKIGDGNGLLN